MYEEMFTVDYQLDECKGKFLADLSFTFLHWKLMEQMQDGIVDMNDIDESIVEIMAYNILPGGNTIMHLLCVDGEAINKIY